MEEKMNTRLLFLFLIVLFTLTPVMYAISNTAGSVEFTVTTKPTGEKYTPQHALAIWVTDSKGNFIKTLKIQGQKTKFFLSTWMTKAKPSEINAVTGATLKAHQIHTVTWDCRDALGNLMPDGKYQIHVEFTEKNGQGPVTPSDYIRFTKGTKPLSLTFDDLTYFYKMELHYTPGDKSSPPVVENQNSEKRID